MGGKELETASSHSTCHRPCPQPPFPRCPAVADQTQGPRSEWPAQCLTPGSDRDQSWAGATPHPEAPVMLLRFKTPEPQASSMASTLFNLATQGPWEPSPWGLSDSTRFPVHPTLISGAWDAFTTSHHPILGLPTTRKPCQGLPTQGTAAGPWGCLGRRGTTRGLSSTVAGSSRLIGPPAEGTRECRGRGDNAGSGTWRGPPRGRTGPAA